MAWVIEDTLSDRMVAAEYALARTGEMEFENITHDSGEIVRNELEWIVCIIVCLSHDFDDSPESQVGKSDSSKKSELGKHLWLKVFMASCTQIKRW